MIERLLKILEGLVKPEVFLGLGILFIVLAEITAIGSMGNHPRGMAESLTYSLPITAAGVAFIIGAAILKK